MAMVVTNACAPDPRVLRHARWMQEVGYTVTVHAFDREEKHPMSENHHGVRIMRYRLGPVAYGGTINTYAASADSSKRLYGHWPTNLRP